VGYTRVGLGSWRLAWRFCFVSVLSLFFRDIDDEKTLSMFKFSGYNKPWHKPQGYMAWVIQGVNKSAAGHRVVGHSDLTLGSSWIHSSHQII
jgi:hypothetical protein